MITTKSTASFDTVSIGSGGIAAATATNSLASGFNDTRVLSGKWETKDSVIQQTVTDIGDYVLSTGISASEFTLEARITLSGNEKSGGGFIFHMPDQGKRSGAYIVRLIDNGGGVFWGYFDQNNGFVGQGTTAITQAATYKLTVNVRADRMDVSVNDKVIFENVKLYRSDGWLGLIAHGGVVKFDKLKLNVTTLSDIQ